MYKTELYCNIEKESFGQVRTSGFWLQLYKHWHFVINCQKNSQSHQKIQGCFLIGLAEQLGMIQWFELWASGASWGRRSGQLSTRPSLLARLCLIFLKIGARLAGYSWGDIWKGNYPWTGWLIHWLLCIRTHMTDCRLFPKRRFWIGVWVEGSDTWLPFT